MKKVKIEVMLQGYGDSHFATSVEEIIEVDDNAPIDDLWAKRIYVEEYSTTDKLSVEKLQEELESCIQTLISVSILANGDENIVIGNFVDSRLSKLAKTHENVTNYIEKVTGKNIDVVLAENAALEAEEEE